MKEELIKLDLEQAMLGSPDHNIMLRDLDRVNVFSLIEMVSKKTISISTTKSATAEKANNNK